MLWHQQQVESLFTFLSLWYNNAFVPGGSTEVAYCLYKSPQVIVSVGLTGERGWGFGLIEWWLRLFIFFSWNRICIQLLFIMVGHKRQVSDLYHTYNSILTQDGAFLRLLLLHASVMLSYCRPAANSALVSWGSTAVQHPPVHRLTQCFNLN